MAHLFICPNCGNRTTETERTAGFSQRAKGCGKCGFGFLFELLDDYYPAPDAAFFVCDAEGRVIGCGRGSFELTGLDDERVIGRSVREVLGLRFADGEDPVATVLEWGVRALGKPVEVHAEGDLPARATADLFPAYDDDGGLLLVLTPGQVAHERPPPQPPRSCCSSPGLLAASLAVIFVKPTRLGLDLKGGVSLTYQAKPTKQAQVTGESIDRAIDVMRKRVDQLGVAEPEIQRTGQDQIDVSLPAANNADEARKQVGTTAQLFFYDWEKNVLGPGCKPAPTDPNVTGGPAAALGLGRPVAVRRRQARRGLQAHEQRRNETTKGSLYVVDDKTKKVARRARRRTGSSLNAAIRDKRLTGRRQRPRSRPCPQGTVVVRAEKASAKSAAPNAFYVLRDDPGAQRQGHQEPRAELRQRRGRHGRAERHLRVQRHGAQGVAGDDARDRPARAEPVLRRRPAVRVPALRDRARRRGHLGAVHRLQPEPRRHRRPAGLGDLRRLHDRLRAGAREPPEDRRAADQARPHLVLAGLGHARQAGARPGPHRRHRRLRRRRALPPRLLPRPGPDRGRRAGRLRDLLLRADQAHPDHADAAGHRGPDPHDRRRGRREHRDLRTGQGGDPRRAVGHGRHRGGLPQAACRRSSTRTS